MTLGEHLKKAREEAGLPLKKFAYISKIQQKYLEQIEEGRYEKLPAFVYIQGFLKKYSEILNLPTDELIEEYKKETQTSRQIQPETELSLLKLPKVIITPKKITWAIIIFIVIVVIGYLIYQLDSLIVPPALSLTYPSEDISTSSSSIEISGTTDYTAKLTINGQQIFVEKDGKFHQEINLSQGVNTLKIEAENRFGKKSEIIRQIVVNNSQ